MNNIDINKNLRKTLFISDLHLDESAQEMTRKFLELLATCDESVDALYILGDLFESWIGDDAITPYHAEIIHALSVCSHKIPIYFIPGNRDFLIGSEFAKSAGCHILGDETKIDLYGTPVLLMHGDTLCTQDRAYLRLRKIFRNKWIQKLFLALPVKWRLRIANQLRHQSAHHTQLKVMEIMDVSQQEVLRVMQSHHVAHLIHGHTHRPFIHKFMLDAKTAKRLVLDAWHERANALIWDETGKQQMIWMVL